VSLTRVAIPSPNYSSRGGSSVSTIVLHTAEGALTYQSLGSFFASPSSQVSSHVGIDDTPNTVGEYVQRPGKAWTAANANPWSVQAELCAFAAWDAATWQAHPQMLANAAAWVAEEAAAFGIPLVKLTPAQAQSGGRGVCEHVDLGSMGGGHTDCGTAFPIDQVLQMAAGNQPAPQPPTPTEGDDDNMVLTDSETGGIWCADSTGAVFTYDGAPYLGGANNDKMNAQHFPCVGIAINPDNKGGGYRLVLDFGDKGSAGGNDRFRRYNFPRNGSGKV
jgi:N-acetylmuramoyl-L-alanine amidase